MSLPLPGNAEFSIISLNDPYQCPETTPGQPALYRRPLPSTNLKFLNGIMWDGRQPDLQSQATNAALIHAQAAQSPTNSQLQTIVDLETSVFTAQSEDNLVGDLTSNANGARYFFRFNLFLKG